MQIVIDISKDIYDFLQKHDTGTRVDRAIANGTPLPKGHGKIVDVDTIDLNQDEFISQSDYYEAECAIDNAPTIIEADHAESEE